MRQPQLRRFGVEVISMSTERLDVDFLVIGGGMAGMTAAAFAAHHGLKVGVIEKGPRLGGSAILSGGCLWTVEHADILDEISPLSERDQRHAVVENYARSLQWLESTGVTTRSMPMQAFHIPASGRLFDVAKYIAVCETYVTAGGGFVVVDTQVDHLACHRGRMSGAFVDQKDGDIEVRADWTLLATGGFQGDPQLRKRYIGGGAESMLLRANPHSVGDGLRLGLAAGAGLSPHMDGYYGHTIATPRNRPFTEKDFLPLSQFFLATHSVVLDRAGRRFIDESRGYYEISQAVCRLPTPRALVLFDDTVRIEDINFGSTDRPAVAEQCGANVARGTSWSEIARQAEAWGYTGVQEAIECFNADLSHEGSPSNPPRVRFRRPLSVGPFFAIEAEPAITFTHGGLRIDANARVLDASGAPLPGLLAAGADAGGTYHIGYGGGLAMACVFGLKAADIALSSAKVS
jgi:succinate dehydrogenase/fumarate reductase flavoprotein subunit